MPVDPLYVFVLAGLFSPGPNVILITTSGARFGFRRTLPHVAGIVVGVFVIAALAGLGVGAVMAELPVLNMTLKIAAATWILWMAWRLFMSTRRPQAPDRDRPFSFIEAVLFQWINAKLWAVALAAATGFASTLPPMQEALRLGTAFSGLNVFVCLFWVAAGSALTYLLTTHHAWNAFTTVMAGFLALSAGMIFL